MKRCPECRRDYYDDTLSFCLDDGRALLEGPASVDDPPTAILSEPGAGRGPQSGIPVGVVDATGFRDGDVTRPQIHTTEAEPQSHLSESPERPSLSAHRAAEPQGDGNAAGRDFDKRLLLAPLLLAVIILGGFHGYRYFSSAGTKQIDSIAVMPFENESGDPDVEYLSDGMTETLINTLSQIPDLNVKARSSVFPYKGKEVDAAKIGEALKVQGVLNGRVVQRGDELTLFLSLEDARTNNRIWGKQYNRNLTNLVALQSEIAKDVSERLKAQLTGAEAQKLSKNSTENAEAYQLYLKGRFYWNKRTEKDLQKSTEYFQQAIALDPNYALAYAGLADSYTSPGPSANLFRRSFGRPERLLKAREAALKALSLDSNLPEARKALGTVLVSEYDFASGEREYRQAIELSPNYADAHYFYALLLSRLGRWEEASMEYRRALELEPLNLIYQANYGGSFGWARRYDEAIAHVEKILELDQNAVPALGNLANAYEFKRDHAKSVELRARELEVNGYNNDAALIRESYAKGGWEGYLRHMTGENRPAQMSFYWLALCYTGLGEKDKAFAALNNAYENRESLLLRLKVDPRLDSLRDDPRFQKLLKKVGFPE